MSCGNRAESQSPMGAAIREASRIYLPLNVTFELSQNCNLRCSHCYNFDRTDANNRPKSEKPPLTPVEIKRVLGEIRAAGGLVVAFSGGEALLHPHFMDFVREARALRLGVRLKSNGTLITQRKARELAEGGVTDLEVSLYGASAETHEAVTCKPGSFARTVDGARFAKQAGIAVTVNFVLHRGCVNEIDAMLNLAEELGAAAGMSTEMTKRYDGTTGSLDLRLTEEDLRAVYAGPRGAHFAGSINREESVQCACARTNAGIGFDGTVYPCIGAPIPAGDLREQSFDQIWRDSKVFGWIRDLRLHDFKDCAPCEKRPYCQRSSGAIHTNTGDYTGKEDWTCMQAGLLKELNER